MNRKTNIFYSIGNDSKFLTFDNYSEALTGDILATDQKLWPSRFICMYVKALDGETTEERELNKKDFINNYLVPYYENKLSFLRDNITNSADLINILPLNYLLDLIYYYAANKKEVARFDYVSEVEQSLYSNNYYNGTISTEDINLCYMSDIVEQDYNGTYADIICTITTNNEFKPVLQFENVTSFQSFYQYKEYDNANNKLYGWENDNNASLQEYINKSIIFDNNIDTIGNTYYINSVLKSIKVERRNEDQNLKFNIVIPVFDSEYINKISVNDEFVMDGKTNVPLGIYFTGKPIELESYNGIFNSNWSLLISMQFKAFPYSFGITHNFDDSDHIKDAYVTFAEILAKQNQSIDKITAYNNLILKLQNKIGVLENKIKTITTVTNVDDLSISIEKLKNKLETDISELEDKIEEMNEIIEMNKLKWQIKNNE